MRHRSADTTDDPLIVLGADTCVVCDGHILGKPTDTADARRMLELLSGRTHAVLTGLAVVSAHKIVRDVEITQVTFNQIDDSEIVKYIASGEPLDKAGAYAIQGYAARWIPRIEGCYFNVVGLADCANDRSAGRGSSCAGWFDHAIAHAIDYSTLAIIAASSAVRGMRCSMTT